MGLIEPSNINLVGNDEGFPGLLRYSELEGNLLVTGIEGTKHSWDI